MSLHISMRPLRLQAQVLQPWCSMQTCTPMPPIQPWNHLEGCCQGNCELKCSGNKVDSTFCASSQQHLYLEACDVQDGHVDELQAVFRDLQGMCTA